MQLLDINGNRLFLPLAIGANVPDEKMAYFIKDWNTSEDRTPGGNFNFSFFRIIIATEGDYFKELSPGHIFYRFMGPKSRDPLDSLLGMENIMGENGISYFPAIYNNVIYGNGPSEPPLSEELPLIEWDLKGTPLPKELQGKVFVLSP